MLRSLARVVPCVRCSSTAAANGPSKERVDQVAARVEKYYLEKGLRRPKAVIRETVLRQLAPHHIDAEEFAKIQRGYTANGIPHRAPIAERVAQRDHLIRVLKQEEFDRLMKQYPKKIDHFAVGDRIAVVRKISLNREKYEVISGVVTSMVNGYGADTLFTIRNYVGESAFSLTLPLCSPFITEICVLQKSPSRRAQVSLSSSRPHHLSHIHALLCSSLIHNSKSQIRPCSPHEHHEFPNCQLSERRSQPKSPLVKRKRIKQLQERCDEMQSLLDDSHRGEHRKPKISNPIRNNRSRSYLARRYQNQQNRNGSGK